MAWGFFTSCLSRVKLGIARGLDLGGKDGNQPSPEMACCPGPGVCVCPLGRPIECPTGISNHNEIINSSRVCPSTLFRGLLTLVVVDGADVSSPRDHYRLVFLTLPGQ